MNSLYYGLGLRSKYKNKNEDKDKVSERAVVNRFRNFNSPETCHIEPCIYESSIIVNLRRDISDSLNYEISRLFFLIPDRLLNQPSRYDKSLQG